APWWAPPSAPPVARSPEAGKVPARARRSAASSARVAGRSTASTRTRRTTRSTAPPTRAACTREATPGRRSTLVRGREYTGLEGGGRDEAFCGRTDRRAGGGLGHAGARG